MKSRVVVSLVGLPGSGKSTVGKALSKNHGWFYVDSDEEIERKTSRTTANIIREDGEKAFRAIESEVIHELICDLVNSSANAEVAVLSLGGGAITTKEVLDLLLSKTVMIYLDIGFEEQLDRLRDDVHRPLIKGDILESLEEKLLRLRKERSRFYECAKYRVDCSMKTDTELANEVVELITKKA